jgi:hypothetical protein
VTILLLFAAAALAGQAATTRIVMRELDSPAPSGSGQPHLVAAADGRTLLSWVEPVDAKRHRLRYSSRSNDRRWSEPRTIAEGAGWLVNPADFPTVAHGDGGTLFAHWLIKRGAGGYDVHVSASRDDGRTWSPAVVPHRDGTDSEHGFVSFARWSETMMGLVWLDGRNTGSGKGATALMYATLDRAGAVGAESILDDRVCDCCQTDAARSGDTTIVAYRDRTDEEVRDISVVRFVAGKWSAPIGVAKDGWRIPGCPVNGPAIAAAERRVVVAWFTGAEGRNRVYAAFSTDAGATFGASILVADERPLGRLDVAMIGDGSAIISWLDKGENAGTLRVRQVAPEGPRGEAATVVDQDASGFPRMAAINSEEVLIAWRDAGAVPHVHVASLTIASR